jgi:hypothetical protein
MITLDALREACRAACACANDGSEPPGTCPACEVWHELKGAAGDPVPRILDALFTNGFGVTADRLTLVKDGEPGIRAHNLGGWSRAGAEAQIRRLL